MSRYVVICLDPTMDTSKVVGTWTSSGRAADAANDLAALGWNTEVCEILSLADVAADGPLDWTEDPS